MVVDYLYWYFDSIYSNKECDKIIKTAEKFKSKKGTINKGKKKPGTSLDIRNSNVVWLNEQWIFDLILPQLQAANTNAGWNHQFDYMEPAQFTIYKKNQFYDWHIDAFTKPYDKPQDPNFHGKMRKLSCTLQLSDASEYEGGELEFYNGHPDKKKSEFTVAKEALKKGTLIVFPSYVFHRVKPVTKGTRKSLVLWTIGHPFR